MLIELTDKTILSVSMFHLFPPQSGGGHPKISPKVLGSDKQSPTCERPGLGSAFMLEYYKNV